MSETSRTRLILVWERARACPGGGHGTGFILFRLYSVTATRASILRYCRVPCWEASRAAKRAGLSFCLREGAGGGVRELLPSISRDSVSPFATRPSPRNAGDAALLTPVLCGPRSRVVCLAVGSKSPRPCLQTRPL